MTCVYHLSISAQVCESECAAVQPPSTGAGPDAGQHATCVDFVTWTGHASLGEGSRDCAECVCQSESNQNSVLACKEAGAGSSACQAASRLSGGACGSVCTPPDPTPPATPPQDDTGGAGDEQLACYLEGIFSGWSESCAACMCSPTLFIPIPISATTWCFEEHGATNCIEAPQCIKEYTDNVNDNWNKYVSSSGANSAYGTVAGLDKHFCCLEKDATGGCASHLLDSDQGRLYLSEMAFGTCAQACQSDL